MLHTGIGANRKLRRLTATERWCYVAGVLAIAAESPVRGVLLIAGRIPAGTEDYAQSAGVPATVGISTVRKLRELGMIVKDEETGFDVVHDWEDWQREPARKDVTAADRMRRYRDKLRQDDRNGYAVTDPVTEAVTGPVTFFEKREGEEESSNEDSSSAVPADQAGEAGKEAREDVAALCSLLADLIAANGSKRPTVGTTWHTAARLLLDRDGRPYAEAERLIRWSQADEFWRTNVLSMPKFREQYDRLRLKAGPGVVPTADRYRSWARQHAPDVDPDDAATVLSGLEYVGTPWTVEGLRAGLEALDARRRAQEAA